MKIHLIKINLDKPSFIAGEKVTGNMLIKTSDHNWGNNGRVFLKFYDKLDIQWLEDELVTIGVTKRAYTNFKKPFQLNSELLLDRKDVTELENDDEEDYKFMYQFEFQLPERLQGTINLENAKCNYFIKAYLADDELIYKHYSKDVNVFDEFFKTLNHTYSKQEVVILNKGLSAEIQNNFNNQVSHHVFEAKSSNVTAIVTLPKIIFGKGDSIPINVVISRTDEDKHNSHLTMHKVSYKLFQIVKLTSTVPYERVRLFENLIAHSSRKHLSENVGRTISLDENIEIPEIIQNSTSRAYKDKEKLNPIRVNYKIRLELWKNFLVDELDINVPILINPEA